MSTDLMISLLDRASSGADILSILDMITAEASSTEYNNSTVDFIES
jgi:hypothetical protein